MAIVPWLQLTPLAQFVMRPRLDEVANEGPGAIGSQDEVATERSQVVHDRDVDDGIRRGGVVSCEQGGPTSVIEQVDDRLISLETQSQPGLLTAWQSDLKVPPATGA
ncbi:hypothetical protein [Streptomyces sp. SD31]|uniref:hypothetical protein n=1 Tax=Streptomyces sp. SD31 TaxID=3452208 RepID=UPI003F8A3E16